MDIELIGWISEDMSDEEIFALRRGGHDDSKLYAAFNKAKETTGQPTVILAKTVKGYSMGQAAEGKNVAHQVKKMDLSSIQHLRDRLNLEDLVPDNQLDSLPYLTLESGTPEHTYLHERRTALNGYLPAPVSYTHLTLPTICSV